MDADDLPDFMQALGLGVEADEREVRRAYARRLKLIDQAADPEGFQALRGAYESALHWLAWRKARQAQEELEQQEEQNEHEVQAEVGAPASAGSEPAPAELPVASSGTEEPAAVEQAASPPEIVAGEAVFDEFIGVASRVFASEDAATQALDHAMADERLVSLEARTHFEWRVACLIMEGWRPGLEFLFAPACKCFGWEQDRRRLSLFGGVGSVLDAAIHEKIMFFNLPAPRFNAQRDVIRRFRSSEPPSTGELLSHVPVVHQLLQRYPHWMETVTSKTHIRQWYESWEKLPAAKREAAAEKAEKATKRLEPPPAPPAKESSFSPWWIIFVVLIVARLLSSLSSPSTPSHAKPAVTFNQEAARKWLDAASRPTGTVHVPKLTPQAWPEGRPPGWMPYEPGPATGVKLPKEEPPAWLKPDGRAPPPARAASDGKP